MHKKGDNKITLKEKLSRKIHEAVDSYDFEEAIDNAVDRLDIEGLITDAIHSKVDKIDIDPILEDFVKDIIEEELDELDLEGEILSAMEDIL